jgi:rRNA maturation RNase YbeY
MVGRDILLEGKCGISLAVLRARISGILDKAGVRRIRLSVVFLSGAAMARLNFRVLAHRGQTDVITFDLGTTPQPPVKTRRSEAGCKAFLEGEIYICPEEVRRNARFYLEPYRREILRCVAHGILHLLGHDDATPAQRARMHESENFLLR